MSGNEYLRWIRNRIANTYKEKDPEILSKLDKIIYNYKLVPVTLPESTINKVCSRYWDTFCLDNNQWILEDIFGEQTVDDQKDNIRSFVMGMLSDIMKTNDSVEEKVHQDQDETDMYLFM